MSVVSEQTAKKLGLRPVARGGLARAVGGGGRFEIVYGFLSSLDIGAVHVDNVPVYIRHFYENKGPIDGYLGVSVISHFITSIDYGESSLMLRRESDANARDSSSVSISRDAMPPTSDAFEIPFRTTSSGFLSGEVRLDGVEKPLNFIIDTGASISVVSEKLAAGEDLASYLEPTRMRVYGAAGISDDVKTLLLPKVMFGATSRERVSAAVLDLDAVNETAGFTQNGILGGNFLRHYRVSFYFQRGLLLLEPPGIRARTGDNAKPNEHLDQ